MPLFSGDGDFSNLPNLANLDLSGNQLAKSTGEMFSGLSNLNKLDLSNNNIQWFDPGICVKLPKLGSLKLNDNQLTTITSVFNNCPVLIALNVANNQLGVDIFSALNSVNWLIEVDISGNIFTTLPYLMLYRMVFLKFLYIRNGRIRHVDANAFVGLKDLRQLDISDNKIIDIHREMFQSLPDSMEAIGFAGNPLICQCETKQVQDWMDSVKLTLLSGAPKCTDNSGIEYNVALSDLTSLCDESVPAWCDSIDLDLIIMESSAERIVCNVQITGISNLDEFDNSQISISYHEIGKSDVIVSLSPHSNEVVLDDIHEETGYVICVGVPVCSAPGCEPHQCQETVTPSYNGTALPTKSQCPAPAILIGGTAAIFVLVLLLMLFLFFIILTKRCCFQSKHPDYKEAIEKEELGRRSTGSMKSRDDVFYESIPDEQNVPSVPQKRNTDRQKLHIQRRHRSVGDPPDTSSDVQRALQSRRSDIVGFVPGKARVYRRLGDTDKQRIKAQSQPNLLSAPSVEAIAEDPDTLDVGIRHRERLDAPFRSAMPSHERKRRMHGSFPKMGQSALSPAGALAALPRELRSSITNQQLPPIPIKESQTFLTKSGMPYLPDIPQATKRYTLGHGTSSRQIYNVRALHSQRHRTLPPSPHFYDEPDL